jgi:error-prone DNA polymerase
MTAFAGLVAATNFSVLDGASHGEDRIGQAIALGHAGIGIADRNTIAGVVWAHKALRLGREGAVESGFPHFDFKLAVAARLVFADGTPEIVAYPCTGTAGGG